MLNYWLLGAAGALSVGFGVVLLFHSNNLMHYKVKFWRWFGVGTIALLFIVAGNSLMLDAGVHLSNLGGK